MEEKALVAQIRKLYDLRQQILESGEIAPDDYWIHLYEVRRLCRSGFVGVYQSRSGKPVRLCSSAIPSVADAHPSAGKIRNLAPINTLGEFPLKRTFTKPRFNES